MSKLLDRVKKYWFRIFVVILIILDIFFIARILHYRTVGLEDNLVIQDVDSMPISQDVTSEDNLDINNSESIIDLSE